MAGFLLCQSQQQAENMLSALGLGINVCLCLWKKSQGTKLVGKMNTLNFEMVLLRKKSYSPLHREMVETPALEVLKICADVAHGDVVSGHGVGRGWAWGSWRYFLALLTP